ncbi:hypothetical protein AB0O04_37275, partial [Streptomyces althioticus]|uniref:hypothetical protein n=1 Tax=Streptomyces althioticus TaxID=83380 RepID=UPI00341C0D72
TSAGTAAGIDLCLHIVRTDHGNEAAGALARRPSGIPPHLYPVLMVVVIILLGIPPLLFYRFRKPGWNRGQRADNHTPTATEG